MARDAMTPRERWLATVERRPPDRVPMYYRATDEVTQKLLRHTGCADTEALFARLHIDSLHTVGPRYVGPPRSPGEDLYGRRRRTVTYDGGSYAECANHPLAGCTTIAQVEAGYTWPTADDFDFGDLPAQVEAARGRVVMAGGSEPFLIYKDLRGDEQAFVDLLENPELVHHCLDRLYGFCYESTQRIFETVPGAVDVTSVAEDMGAQDRLLYSRAHLEAFFFPYMKRMMDLARQAGVRVDTHTDGAVRDILPDLLDMGMDVLNPVQWRCAGMDRQGLKRDFGDRLVFEGGMDNQQTLPFGTVAQVRQEVCDNLAILGAGGGYILAPCHNIQVVGPAQNVVAMYETGYEEGRL